MNWGNKLLVTFIVFAGGMSFLVYRSVKTNYELVEKDYYKSEIGYQQVIDGANRANKLSSPVKFEQRYEKVFVSFPEEVKGKAVTGEIWFYCSYDQHKDKKISVAPDKDGIQSFAATDLATGKYTVKVKWECGGEQYFSESPFTIL